MPIGFNHETENINAHQDIVLQTGSIFGNARSSVPTGYLLCDGSLVSRTIYSRLFNAIGTTYGSGNGSTTFAIPDGRGGVLRGAGTSSGYAQNVTVTLGVKDDDTSQDHKHNDSGHNHTLNYWVNANGGSSIWGLSHQGPVGSQESNGWLNNSSSNANITGPVANSGGAPRLGNETKMKNVGVNFFIKF